MKKDVKVLISSIEIIVRYIGFGFPVKVLYLNDVMISHFGKQKVTIADFYSKC